MINGEVEERPGLLPCKDVRAVLFDFDGTLVHLNIDFAQMRAGVEAILPQYGLYVGASASRYTLELIEENVETLTTRDGEEIAAAFQRDAEAAIVAVEVDAADEADIHQGAPELLRWLREEGVRVGIVTRNCRAAVDRILERNTLLYDVLLTRDDVELVKPDPEHLRAALRVLEVEPQHALMVGDHPMDVRAGRLAGTRTVAVLTGYSPAERFTPEGPDLVLNRVGDLGLYLAAKGT